MRVGHTQGEAGEAETPGQGLRGRAAAAARQGHTPRHALSRRRQPQQGACPPHGDVLLEAGAEGAAGDLADLLAVGRQHLHGMAGVCARACERRTVGWRGRGRAALQRTPGVCVGGRRPLRAGPCRCAAGQPARLLLQQGGLPACQPTSECCRAGAPLLTKPTRRTLTPSASCCLMTCRRGGGGKVLRVGVCFRVCMCLYL